VKAQFKYAFLNGIYIRGPVFAVIFVMNTVFIALGSAGLLPVAARITAVSLGGVAIAVMMAANFIGDINISRRIFAAPGAYLQMLTPAPRWKTLFASIAVMAVMDIVSMAFVIASQVFLALNLAGGEIQSIVVNALRDNPDYLIYGLFGALLIITAYLLVLSIILFAVTAQKSFLYKLPASGFLAFLLAWACVYAVSLSQLVLAPFGSVWRYGIFIIITLGSNVMFMAYILLLLLEAITLFIITSNLLEKRINL